MITIEQHQVESAVRTIAATVLDNEAYFGELDGVVGDGDFGFSLARGFEAVIESWDVYPRTDIGAFLQAVAVTISNRVGGTSGPIWGTAFLRAAVAARGRQTLTRADLVTMLRAAVDGIMQRGRAELGDKTLLDALVPLIDAVESAADQPLAAAAAAARKAVRETSGLQARRGRASYSGERSIGVPDAGAVAIAVLAEALNDEQTTADRAGRSDRS